MNDQSNSLQAAFGNRVNNTSSLAQYIESLNPEAIARLSTPPTEVQQAMEANLQSLLGGLPPQHFGVTITTSRENLGRLLASAMMNGYFLHSVQQRMDMEQAIAGAMFDDSDANSDS